MLYFTIFFLLFIAGFLDLSDIPSIFRNVVFWLFIFVLIVLGAIRWRTGTDWFSYLIFFTRSNTYTEFTSGAFEYGYGLIAYISKSISTDYSLFLAIFAFLTISIKGYALKQSRYGEYFLISLLIFYCYYIGDIFPIRQSLALSITLFSGKYILEKKLVPFLICVFIATLIHNSSIVFLIAYPIAFVNLKTSTAFFVLISSAIIGYVLVSLNSFEWLTKIPGLTGDAQDKLEVYSQIAAQGGDTTGGSNVDPKVSFITGLIRKIVVLVPLVYFRKQLAEKYEHFNVFFNLIVFGAVFYFILGSLVQVLKRGASYFDFFEVLVIPMFIFLGETKWQRIIIYIIVAFYGLAKLYMVLNYYWDLFIPFYTIFHDSIPRY